ncbi:MAG: hypothetical protein HYU36_17735 [Planctomycetes bacterium]|nr:hypothetical protein [Planctomycetota bacterium]
MSRFSRSPVFLAYLLFSVMSDVQSQQNPLARPPAVQNPLAKPKPKSLHFLMQTCVDKEGTGKEAFRFLIPAGWKFEGGVRWNLACPGMPATVSYTVRNPAGDEVLEVFPNQIFFYTTDPTSLSFFPVGSNYLGSEVRPLADASKVLAQIVLPRFRRSVTGLRQVREEKLPDLARQLRTLPGDAAGVTTFVDAAKLRVEYPAGQRMLEEDLTAVVESASFNTFGMNGAVTMTNWLAEYLMAFRTEKGKLDANARVFQTMVTSFRWNPQWFNQYTQVSQALIQMKNQQIQQAANLSRILSQTQNEISDIIMKSYEERQAAYDRISTNFSQAIRGVESFRDPVGERSVELPSGYGRAWANGLGEYIVSDDPSYNPNEGTNQTWRVMEKGE